MSGATEADPLTEAIRETVLRHMERAREDAIRRAVEEFEAQLRESLARVSLSTLSFYEIHRDARGITIRVEDARKGETKP